MKNKKYKKFLLKIERLIDRLLICIGILLVFIMFPIFLEEIINQLVIYNIIPNELSDSFIGFYGTIISGIFTIIGVVATIKYESKIKKQDDTIVYKPILALDETNKYPNCLLKNVGLMLPFYSNSSDFDNEKREAYYYQQLNREPKFRLNIKNKGRAETFNTILNEFRLTEVSWDKESGLYSSHSGGKYVGEILKDEYMGIDIRLPDYLFMPENNNKKDYYLCTEIYISYSDMFDRIKYQYIIYLNFKVYIEKYEEESLFYKEGYKYAKVQYEIDKTMNERKIYSAKQNAYVHEFYYNRNPNFK